MLDKYASPAYIEHLLRKDNGNIASGNYGSSKVDALFQSSQTKEHSFVNKNQKEKGVVIKVGR